MKSSAHFMCDNSTLFIDLSFGKQPLNFHLLILLKNEKGAGQMIPKERRNKYMAPYKVII